jgi:hypothetical protein
MLVDYSFIQSDAYHSKWIRMLVSGKRISRPRPLPLRTARDTMFEAILKHRILLLWLR